MSNQQNTVLAIVLSIIVIVGFEFFYFAPQREALELYTAKQAALQQEAASQAGGAPATPSAGDAPSLTGEAPSLPGGVTVSDESTGMSRERALAATPRIEVRTPRLRGSLSLEGGRIDDITLIDYRETIDPESPQIVLLSPQGSENAYFTEFGWIGPNGPMPDRNTLWRANGTVLTPERPVTLTWDNGEGLIFSRQIAIDDEYMFTVTQRVENRRSAAVELLPYSLINRSNTPETLGFYILHEGLLGVFDGTLSEIDYDDLQEEPKGTISVQSTGGWIGITDKYWLVALLPDQSVPITARFIHTNTAGTDKYQVDTLRAALTVPAGGAVEITDRVFVGAKVVSVLDAYGEALGNNDIKFDLAVDFGWFYFITKPIFFALSYFYGLFGNYGLAILLLTVLIKAAFFPLANKSYKSMSKMKKLQPKITELREKFGDDKAGMQKEMMALYKTEKVNPAAGCLPVIVQIPVFFSLYKVLFVTIEMRHAPFFGWIQDLSAPDPTSIFNLFGLIPWTPPDFLTIGVWALLMGATMWLQQKLNPQPPDPMQAKIMMMLPIMFTFILARFPAGLVIYWCWNNILSIAQQWIIMRKMGVKI
jgi:YidC/Oxa1 family membrane protein insertase